MSETSNCISRASLEEVIRFESQLSPAERSASKSLFGITDLRWAYDRCGLSLALRGQEGQLEALAMFDCLLLSAVGPEGDAVDGLRALCGRELSAFGVEFLNFFWRVGGDEAEAEADLEKCVRFLFWEFPRLRFCAARVAGTPNAGGAVVRALRGGRLFARKGEFGVVERKNVVESLRVRKAREEDTDDLAAIADSQTEISKSEFGPFFLNELIASQGGGKACLVAENSAGRVVGALVVTEKVNYSALASEYDLGEFGYFTGSDFYELATRAAGVEAAAAAVAAAFARQGRRAQLKLLKLACSRPMLGCALQDFCADTRENLLEELEEYVAEPERKPAMSKIQLRKIIEGHLKGFKMPTPDPAFAEVEDNEVTTCIMGPFELLIDVLRGFDLPYGYLDGAGHWRPSRRKKDDLEGQKPRGLLSKKKPKLKGKKNDEPSVDPFQARGVFDIRPMVEALVMFFAAGASVRESVCSLFRANKERMKVLFCRDNGEMNDERCVDFDTIFEFLETECAVELEEEVVGLAPYVLQNFGGLETDVGPPAERKRTRRREKEPEKVRRLTSFSELFEAVESMSTLDALRVDAPGLKKKLAEANAAETKEAVEKVRRAAGKLPAESGIKGAEKGDESRAMSSAPGDLRMGLDSPPPQLRSAAAIALFFIDRAYEPYANEFLAPAFEAFPSKDFLICAAPTRAREPALLRSFAVARPNPAARGGTALYALHRAQLMLPWLRLRPEAANAFEELRFAVELAPPSAPPVKVGRVTLRRGVDPRRLAAVSDLPRLLAVESGRLAPADVVAVEEVEVAAPLPGAAGWALREAMRRARAAIAVTADPDAPTGARLLPPLPPAAFVIDDKTDPSHTPRLFVHCPRTLALRPTNINHRVVVVGASSCGLALLQVLCESAEYRFSRVTLVSAGFPWRSPAFRASARDFFLDPQDLPRRGLANRVALVAARVVAMDRKTRSVKAVAAGGEEFQLDYDVLVLAVGLEEKTAELCAIPALIPVDRIEENILRLAAEDRVESKRLSEEALDRIDSNRPEPAKFDLDEINRVEPKQSNADKSNRIDPIRALFDSPRGDSTRSYVDPLERLESAPSLSDPTSLRALAKRRRGWLHSLLNPKSSKTIIIYGSSIQAFVVISDLLGRLQVSASRLTLALPRIFESDDSRPNDLEALEREIENPLAFGERRVFDYLLDRLVKAGVNVLPMHKLISYSQSEKQAVFLNLKISERLGAVGGKRKPEPDLPDPHLTIENCLIITADSYDVPQDIFNTAQENGLVFNGRLIVQSDFTTIDDTILAAGRSCEFSQRYKNLAGGRPLRMDQLNQAELGQYIGECLLKRLTGRPDDDAQLKIMKQPVGKYTDLAFGLKFIRLSYPFRGRIDSELKINKRVTDFLDRENPEYFSLGFDDNEELRSIVYLGTRRLNHQALKNLLGLHLTFFNNIDVFTSEDPSLSMVDFLNEDWAKVFCHPMFPKFVQTLKRIHDADEEIRADFASEIEARMKKSVKDALVYFLSQYQESITAYLLPEEKIKLF